MNTHCGTTQTANHRLPAFRRIQIGGYTVTAIADGYLEVDAGFMSGATQDEMNDALAASHLRTGTYDINISALLIEKPGSTILIDTGAGSLFGPTLGNLAGALQFFDLQPGDIDDVVFTHLHPDHIGGAILDDTATFPNATLRFSELDRAFWTDEALKSSADEQSQPLFAAVETLVRTYSDRIETFSGEAGILPGLTAMPLPGHTPGHCGFWLQEGGDKLFIWGDVVHIAPLQFSDLNACTVYDVDPAATIESRQQALDIARAEDALIAGMHLPFPGFGYVETLAEDVRFEPLTWDLR